jgi:hypothetical protein
LPMRLNFHVFALVKIGSISYYRAVYGWRVKIKSEVMEWLKALVLAGDRGTRLNPLTKSPSSMIVKALMRNAAPGRSHYNRLQELECSTPEEVLNCDALVIATEWEEFNRGICW